ncbi:MAG: helix-turn-helix domain-containing protein, partial [Myxococcota bacterium]
TDIAQRAGLSKAALYRYFPHKAALDSPARCAMSVMEMGSSPRSSMRAAKARKTVSTVAWLRACSGDLRMDRTSFGSHDLT